MVLKLLREGLGRMVVLVDRLTRPSPIQRSAERQAEVDAAVREMRLYQFYACPFCVKTRRVIRRLNLSIETRNATIGSPYRDELERGGGRIQVPCLYLRRDGEDIWMYESDDIIRYLEQHFGEPDSEFVR